MDLEFKPEFLERSFEEAEIALSKGEVPIGCVFVLNNREIIASGRNTVNETSNSTKHAEINCVDDLIEAGRHEVFDRIVVYVNVEPCIMCASALNSLNVAAIYFGCYNDRFGGCGSVIDIFKLYSEKSSNVIVKGGFSVFRPERKQARAPLHEMKKKNNFMSFPPTPSITLRDIFNFTEDRAVELLKKFYTQENPNAPLSKRKIKLEKDEFNGSKKLRKNPTD